MDTMSKDERAAGLARFVPRVLGITDPVKVHALGVKAAEIEAAQTWRTAQASDELAIAVLLRAALELVMLRDSLKG